MFETSTRRLNREIRVNSLEQGNKTANFTFEFLVDQPNLYQSFCEQIIKSLEFSAYNASTSSLVLAVSIPETKSDDGDGDRSNGYAATATFTVTGDAQLRTALMSTSPQDTFCVSVSTRRKSNIFGASGIFGPSKAIQVTCSLFFVDGDQQKTTNTNQQQQEERERNEGKAETTLGAFRYRFVPGKENLLENFKEECMDALDLFGAEASAFGLRFKLDGEWIPITGDRAVLEVLATLTEAGTASLEARLTQTPLKASVTNLTLRCIFDGTLRESGEKLRVSSDLADRFLDTLAVECKALWDLTPSERVTLFDATVPPTDYNTRALISSNAKAELVIDAAKQTHDKTLVLRMERGNLLPELRTTVSTHIHVLYLDSETNKFEQEAEFDFSWDGNPAHCRGAFTSLADKIRVLLHLTVPFDLFLGADSKGEIPPQSVKTDEQVQQFLVSAPEHSQLFCVKNALHQDADETKSMTSPLPVGRASYLRALVHDWRQILPRQVKDKEPIRITVEAMKPIVATWHLTWELHRREITLLQQFEDFSANSDNIRGAGGDKGASLPLDELFSVLMRWTSYLVDDEVADFARHCQNMVDFLAEISNEARCNRLSAKCFSALRSVGSVVKPDLLVRAFVLSGTVGRQEAHAVAEGYSADGIEAWEFDEILTYFFLDDAAAFQKLLGACARLRTTPDYSQHDITMKSVRELRLRSELRHALDGVVAAHLTRFAKDNWGLVATGSTITVPQNFLDLAWCVSCLLNHPTSASTPSESDTNTLRRSPSPSATGEEGDVEQQQAFFETKLNCWRWLIGECSKDQAAADFLTVIRSTGLSYCSDAILQRVGVAVYNDGLDARLLHTTAGAFLSNLAQWCYVLQDLTFLVRNLSPKTNKKEQSEQPSLQKQQSPEDETDSSVAAAADDEKSLELAKEKSKHVSPQKSATSSSSAASPASSFSPIRVRYSPPRVTMGLRPTPPTAEKSPSSPSSAAIRGSASTANNNNNINNNNNNNNNSSVSSSSIRNHRMMTIISPRSTMTSAGYGLSSSAPTQDLNELLRLQKEENLLREFDPATADERREKVRRANRHGGTQASTTSGTNNNNNSNNTNTSKVRNSADFALFTIKGAAGLVKHPMLHSVDSYVVAYDPSGAVVHQTPVIEGTCSPQYPATARFIVPLSDNGSVVFHILTESNVSGFLGEVTMKLQEATFGGTREVCLKVKPRRGETDELLIENARDLGCLTVEVVPLKEPIFLPRSEPQGFIVWGKVCGADNLSAPEPNERRDFFVQVLDRAECPVRRTDCASRSSAAAQAPRWTGINREFVLPLEQAIETISFKLVDEDLKGGRLFGTSTLHASDLIKQTKEQRELQQASPANDEFATHRLALKAEPSSPSSMTGRASAGSTLTVTARVLGPLPDDLAWRKRQEEAKRLAQSRAEELAEEKRKREAETYERMLEDQEYIKAAEREAEKQRASRAAAERKKEDERAAKREEDEKQARIAEAQQRAKKAALDAAEQDERDEESQRRRAQKERVATAEAEERRRMASIDDEMKKALDENEVKERIRRQLEKEDAERRRHDELMEEEKKKEVNRHDRDTHNGGSSGGGANSNNNNNNTNNNNNHHRSNNTNNDNSNKSQQEIAEAVAKAELKRALEEDAAAQERESEAQERHYLEAQEETPRRQNLTNEYTKECQELVQNMSKERDRLVEASKVVQEVIPVPTAAPEKHEVTSAPQDDDHDGVTEEL